MIPNIAITIIFGVFLFSLNHVIKYYEEIRRTIPENADYKHAFSYFVRFLVIGALFLGLFIGLIIANMLL